MWAVIFEGAGEPGAGLHDVAGRPLLIRQLQWLRDNRVAPIVVEVREGARAAQLAALLLDGSDPLLDGCIVLPSAAPLGLLGAATRAGAPRAQALLGLASDVLVSGALPVPCREGRYRAEAPPGFAQGYCEFSVAGPGTTPASARQHVGWGLRIDSRATAHALACAVLDGRAPGVLLHAAEVEPGIWLSRGAHVEAGAQLRAPVLIGPDAHVLDGALVGPEAILGTKVLVERGARVSRASVGDLTWVGEGASLCEVHAEGAHTASFVDGTERLEQDPLLLRSRRAAPGTTPAARLAALLLLSLLALPWCFAALLQRLRGRPAAVQRALHGQTLRFGALGSWLDRVPPLLDVLLGRRDLLGPIDPELVAQVTGTAPRLGALDLMAALAPSPYVETRRRMWRWYALHRSPGLALRLAWRALRGRS